MEEYEGSNLKQSKASFDSDVPSRLVGWIVSYGISSRGSYYELREGRSFIGGGSIVGERNIAIDPKTLKAAHAAVTASALDGVLLQDIFSPGGTFVMRNGSSQEEQISNSVQLEHGDWVRFGDTTRFQLCLIHGGSR